MGIVCTSDWSGIESNDENKNFGEQARIRIKLFKKASGCLMVAFRSGVDP